MLEEGQRCWRMDIAVGGWEDELNNGQKRWLTCIGGKIEALEERWRYIRINRGIGR